MKEELILISPERIAALGTIVIVMGIFCVVFLATTLSVWIAYSMKNDRLKERNKFLRNRLAAAEHELYTREFKENLVNRDA